MSFCLVFLRLGHHVVAPILPIWNAMRIHQNRMRKNVDRNVFFKMLSIFVVSYLAVVMVTCECTDQISIYGFCAPWKFWRGYSSCNFFLGSKWISRPSFLETDWIWYTDVYRIHTNMRWFTLWSCIDNCRHITYHGNHSIEKIWFQDQLDGKVMLSWW